MDDYANTYANTYAHDCQPLAYPATNHRFYPGFSLTELMTTLAVVSILAFGAGPSLHAFTASNRITTSMNEFIAHLYLTRSEAVKRGYDVIMCPSMDSMNCDRSSQWQHGWIVFPDINHNKRPDPEEQILRYHGTVKGVDIRSGKKRYRVKYSPLGNSYSSNTTFTFCDIHGKAPAQAVILSPSGRPRTSGRDPYNKPLKCG